MIGVEVISLRAASVPLRYRPSKALNRSQPVQHRAQDRGRNINNEKERDRQTTRQRERYGGSKNIASMRNDRKIGRKK